MKGIFISLVALLLLTFVPKVTTVQAFDNDVGIEYSDAFQYTSDVQLEVGVNIDIDVGVQHQILIYYIKNEESVVSGIVPRPGLSFINGPPPRQINGYGNNIKITTQADYSNDQRNSILLC